MRDSKFRRSLPRAALICVAGAISQSAHALPIGFGRNQADLVYDQLPGKGFVLYHDHRVPNEARMTLEALERAKPIIERWVGSSRDTTMPVIMSAVTDNPSFANFVTDALELQTDGTGPRDLALHEFVHGTMYRHFHNWFGPPGAILHLPWMPAWWIEGLAESIAISQGADIQSGIERYHALTGDWPSYDRLHSLYDGSGFGLTGYATSGAFASWILRTTDATRLPALHQSFYTYSMPWWWPWAAVPWNGFMPMDKALETLTPSTGKELYEAYKSAATNHWRQVAKRPPLVAERSPRRAFHSVYSLDAIGNDVTLVSRSDNDTLVDSLVRFDNRHAWATGLTTRWSFPTNTRYIAHTNYGMLKTSIKSVSDWYDRESNSIVITDKKNHAITIDMPPDTLVSRLVESTSSLIWLEQRLETTRLCHISKSDIATWRIGQPAPKPTCPIAATTPVVLSFLGEKRATSTDGGFAATEVWLRRTTQTAAGDQHEVLVWDASTSTSRAIAWQGPITPHAVAFTTNATWMIGGSIEGRDVYQVQSDGTCVGRLGLSDLPLAIAATADGRLALGLHAGRDQVVRLLDRDAMKTLACGSPRAPDSPILYGMRHPEADARTALAATNPWESTTPVETAASIKELPLGDRASNRVSTPAEWRPRPVLAFPWIGADDALGYQYGLVSVPLMDHLQNETVRLTALYGTESRFPHVDVNLTSTRYLSTLEVDAFRYQTYNGYYVDADGYGRATFYDERGGRFTSTTPLYPLRSYLTAGIKTASLKRFIGPAWMGEGLVNEPFVGFFHASQSNRWFWSLDLDERFAPSAINPTFDYNRFSLNAGIGRRLSLLDSTLRVGMERNQTRGPHRIRNYSEEYRPLRTFVPGSGGGYNKNNFLLAGNGSLFWARQGDTQGRLSANWTFPLIPEVDRLWWIFYLDRLDFTAFYNYGGAWYQKPIPTTSDLVAAHGYNMDLQLDVKGVRFNLGLGAGALVGGGPQVYMTSGFDAVF